MMPGGLTKAKPATPEVQEIADEVKPQLEEQTNETYEEFEAVEYKTQVVAGINYYIKVKPQLEEQTNETYEEYKAIVYKTQVVAGMFYYIKVGVGRDHYIHIKVFQSLQQQQSLKLTGYQTDKSKDDELTGF